MACIMETWKLRGGWYTCSARGDALPLGELASFACLLIRPYLPFVTKKRTRAIPRAKASEQASGPNCGPELQVLRIDPGSGLFHPGAYVLIKGIWGSGLGGWRRRAIGRRA